MGNYATNQDVIDRFESVADAAHATDSTDSTTPDIDVLTDAIEYAEGLVNSYLAKRYQTPLDVSLDVQLANLLRGIVSDIAVFEIVGTRNDLLSDAKQNAYDRRIEWLERIADGKLMLTGAIELAVSQAVALPASWGSGDHADDTGTSTNDAASTRAFSRAEMTGI